MANPTTAELFAIRYWVPEEWTPTEKFNTGAVFQTFQRMGTVHKTALALSRLKLALMVENPASFSITGEYSESRASTVAALHQSITKLEKLVDADHVVADGLDTLHIGKLIRCGGPKR